MATIEINDKKISTDPGRMIIEVADENDIYIPRFCYHKKLSIAANCRMCLVEVEKVGKAVPACATPISDGMKVYTRSPKAIAAQKSVMEFLLINHPLDCPVCDQGGECELQDLSMGYGKDVSEYSEAKRSVEDEDLGSLIATDMTRCIHCTRCVRFGEEIAGVRELGATGRGENMRIGTYIKHSLTSEVSGNIIDLCPVGALTSKPFRFKARAWEMQQRSSIAPHDCLGSNIHLHVRRNEIMRVAPKENEEINETWLSDRDRFSYSGIHSEERLGKPMIKQNGHWVETDWETALTVAVVGLKKAIKQHGLHSFGALASPQSTLEEAYLFQKLVRGIGSNNIDHRLQSCDFADDSAQDLYPRITIPYQDIENQNAILLIGSNLHREQPLAALRVRKAMQKGAKIMSVHYRQPNGPFEFGLTLKTKVSDFVLHLSAIVKAAVSLKGIKKSPWESLLLKVGVSKEAEVIAEVLANTPKSLLIIGQYANNHPQASIIRALSSYLSEVLDIAIANMSPGCNSAGAYLAGVLPHRQPGGVAVENPGLNAHAMVSEPLKAYLLLGVEPELDCHDGPLAFDAMHQADCVVGLTAYKSARMLEYSDVLLPVTSFAEMSGTFVNIEGRWQGFRAAIPAFEQARPAWKVLRVLGNLFSQEGFEYVSSEEVTKEIKSVLDATKYTKPEAFIPSTLTSRYTSLTRISEWAMYAGDPIVRRAAALQDSASNDKCVVVVHPEVAKSYRLAVGSDTNVIQGDEVVAFPVETDPLMPQDGVFLPCGLKETACLQAAFGPITFK